MFKYFDVVEIAVFINDVTPIFVTLFCTEANTGGPCLVVCDIKGLKNQSHM